MPSRTTGWMPCASECSAMLDVTRAQHGTNGDSLERQCWADDTHERAVTTSFPMGAVSSTFWVVARYDPEESRCESNSSSGVPSK
jgi:cob(I)alamin adenosyltransferase